MFVWSVAFNTKFLGYFETDAVKTKHKYHGRWDRSPYRLFLQWKCVATRKQLHCLSKAWICFYACKRQVAFSLWNISFAKDHLNWDRNRFSVSGVVGASGSTEQ